MGCPSGLSARLKRCAPAAPPAVIHACGQGGRGRGEGWPSLSPKQPVAVLGVCAVPPHPVVVLGVGDAEVAKVLVHAEAVLAT